MGAAYDAMCENENLQNTLKSKNRKINEQKKLIIELAQAIKDSIDGIFREEPYKKACRILNKNNGKKRNFIRLLVKL